MTRVRWAFVVIPLVTGLGFVACTLNPQPLPPADPDTTAGPGKDPSFETPDRDGVGAQNDSGATSPNDDSGDAGEAGSPDAGDAGDAGSPDDAG